MRILTFLGLFLVTNIALGQSKEQMKEMNLEEATVIEYVSFETKEGIAKETILKALKDTDTVLQEIDGFVYRFIALQENNTWVEVVYWKSKPLAEAGLQKFLGNPISKKLLEMLKEGSVKIQYSEIL